MNEISFSAAAHLTADPELRYTPSARPVATVRLAVNSRRRTAEGEWVDAATTFLDGTVWGEQAERAASRLQKGDRVVVTGTLVTAPGLARTAPSGASLKSRSTSSARRCCSATCRSSGNPPAPRAGLPPWGRPVRPASTLVHPRMCAQVRLGSNSSRGQETLVERLRRAGPKAGPAAISGNRQQGARHGRPAHQLQVRGSGEYRRSCCAAASGHCDDLSPGLSLKLCPQWPPYTAQTRAWSP